MTTSKKNKSLAIVLAIFLGGFGAHRFYLDKPGTAIVMMLLTFTVVLAIVSGIWALIDVVVLLTGNMKDGSGNKVK